VSWVSLAPRFVGRFEKGVEFQGDLDLLKTDLFRHAEIARAMGPYKLSLHSGSDKFSVYPLLAEATRGLAHLKTAGTSYLEGLRVIAAMEPAFFRQILELSRLHYDSDRASYHVSADLKKVPHPGMLKDAELPGLLDQFDARQVLHVTFGTVLQQMGDRLKSVLKTHQEPYNQGIQRHFERHLRPLVR
jgi:tagaturonate epimerase